MPLTVKPEDSEVELFGKKVGAMQRDVEVGKNAITGRLFFIEGGLADSGPLAGDGNFLALKFDHIDADATSVKVGLDPSQGSGLAEIINDPDKNGVFKVTDKDAQSFVVQITVGSKVTTTTYDLSGLVCDTE